VPELPEVHTIAADLKKQLEKSRVIDVTIENSYKTYPGNAAFIEGLKNAVIEKIGRVGKNIVIKIHTGSYLTFHLAMTGRILLRTSNTTKDPWQRLEIALVRDRKTHYLRFCDMRMFGKASLLTGREAKALREKYGPDAVGDEISADEFLHSLKKKRTNIKNALLDQSILAGVGNIYANDALWLAKIHPATKTAVFTYKKVQTLLKCIQAILKEGILHRGSTLPDEAYVDIFGQPGKHQNYFRIYGKNNCPECKTKVVFTKINGRGTYFCPNCQK